MHDIYVGLINGAKHVVTSVDRHCSHSYHPSVQNLQVMDSFLNTKNVKSSVILLILCSTALVNWSKLKYIYL